MNEWTNEWITKNVFCLDDENMDGFCFFLEFFIFTFSTKDLYSTKEIIHALGRPSITNVEMAKTSQSIPGL